PVVRQKRSVLRREAFFGQQPGVEEPARSRNLAQCSCLPTDALRQCQRLVAERSTPVEVPALLHVRLMLEDPAAGPRRCSATGVILCGEQAGGGGGRERLQNCRAGARGG